MKHIVVTMLLAGSLVGCAGQTASPWLVTRENSKPKECQPLTSDQELVLGLSQEIASSGRLHAALANLERLPENLPEARLRKAQLLRVLGRSEAEKLYADLINTCLKADAHHGLGQIEVARKNYDEALKHLRIATSLSPANDAMRNDLGVAYLNMHRITEATFELMTAMELNETDTRAAQNMLTLLIYQDKWQNARRLVASKKLSKAQFRQSEIRARTLQAEYAAQQAAPAVAQQAQPKQERASGTVSRTNPTPVQSRAAAARPSSVAAQPRTASRPSPAVVQPSASNFRPSPTPVTAQPSAAVFARRSATQSDTPVFRSSQAPGQPAMTSNNGSIGAIKRVPSAGARPVRPITGY